MPDRHTEALNDLAAQNRELATHIRGLAADLKVERDARQEVEKNGVSIFSIRVPLLVAFALLSPLVGVGIAGGLFYHQASDHFDDKQIHVDRNEVLAKKGVAYTKDVEDKINGLTSDVEDHDRKALRLLLKERPLVCGAPRGKNKVQECQFGDQPAWNR